MAARTNKIRHDENTRLKIKTSQLLNRLSDHVFGNVELSPTQVRSAEILLRKTMPDLSQIDGSMKVTHELSEMSDAELAVIAAGGRPQALISESIPEESDQVH